MEDFRNELKEKAQEMRRHFEQQRDEYIDGIEYCYFIAPL